MDEKDFKKILERHQEGASSDSERNQISDFEHYLEAEHKSKVFKSEWHKNQIQKSILIRVKDKIQPQRYTNWYWMVAGVSIIIATALSFWLNTNLVTSLELVKISGQENQIKTIVLHDGSKVTLNENSVLEFPGKFSDTIRFVKLRGEAYFNVKHDSTRPFKVYANGIVTKVLGTEFNIDTKDQKSSVALISGSVQVDGLGVSEVLQERQKIEFNYQTNKVERKGFDPQLELFWIHQQLVFNNEPLGQIAKTLERQFEVSIIIEDESLSNLAVSGAFKGKGLSSILLSLSKAAGFEFKGLKSQDIIIYKSQS